MTKKIAVVFTGIIGQKTNSLYCVRRLFEHIKNICGDVELDFYCHAWDNTNRYPENPMCKIGDLIIPSETIKNHTAIQDILRPKKFFTNNYMDFYLEYQSHLLKNISINSTIDKEAEEYLLYKPIDIGTKTDLYVAINNGYIDPKFIAEISTVEYEKDFYLKAYLSSLYSFFSKWSRFIQDSAQAFSFDTGLKQVVNSGIEYDGVLRWRYDIVTDFSKPRLHDEFKTLFDKNPRGFTVHNIWDENKNWLKEEVANNLPKIPDQNNLNKSIFLADFWYYCDMETARILSENYYKTYAHNLSTHIHELQYLKIYKKQLVNSKSPHELLYQTIKSYDLHLNIHEINVALDRIFLLTKDEDIDRYYSNIDWTRYEKWNSSNEANLVNSNTTTISTLLDHLNKTLDLIIPYINKKNHN